MSSAGPPAQTRRIPPCPDCGGTRVGALYLADGQGWSTSLVRPPKRRLWWRNDALAKLVAFVCVSCGHVKLYADDLARLQAATYEHPEWFRW